MKRVIFCSGKVYYDLAKERKEQNLAREVAIIWLEQVPKSLLCSRSMANWTEWGLLLYFSFFFSVVTCPRSLHSPLTWSEQKWRSMSTQSWSGVRRSTRTWATTITFGHASSQCWPTGSRFGKISVGITNPTSSHRRQRVSAPFQVCGTRACGRSCNRDQVHPLHWAEEVHGNGFQSECVPGEGLVTANFTRRNAGGAR